MKVCVSNIAWRPEEEASVAKALQAAGVTQVEIAPMRAVPQPWQPDPAQARQYRNWWQDHGISVVAMQALLFGRDGLALFEEAEKRQRTREHLLGVFDLAALLGAQRLVFGSPGQRKRGQRPEAEVWEIAVEFFRDLGHEAARRGTCLCIEPNPPQYGCDWVTDAATGARLVREVASPGFGLHLDAAGMHMAGDDGPQSLRSARDVLRHVHFSAPQLQHVHRSTGVDYPALAAALRDSGYTATVSIEMRNQPDRSNLPYVLESVAFVQQLVAG